MCNIVMTTDRCDFGAICPYSRAKNSYLCTLRRWFCSNLMIWLSLLSHRLRSGLHCTRECSEWLLRKMRSDSSTLWGWLSTKRSVLNPLLMYDFWSIIFPKNRVSIGPPFEQDGFPEIMRAKVQSHPSQHRDPKSFAGMGESRVSKSISDESLDTTAKTREPHTFDWTSNKLPKCPISREGPKCLMATVWHAIRPFCSPYTNHGQEIHAIHLGEQSNHSFNPKLIQDEQREFPVSE